jgi:hypothetical protein
MFRRRITVLKRSEHDRSSELIGGAIRAILLSTLPRGQRNRNDQDLRTTQALHWCNDSSMLPRTPPTPFPSHTSRRQALVLFAAGVGSLLGSPFAKAAETNPDPFVYGTGIDGHDVTSLSPHGTRYIAAIFVATDCPISNRYLPLLARLSKQFAPRGVRLWLVYPNPGDTLAAVRAHQSQYPSVASLPQLIAPDPRFLGQAHVHVTPEAAIFRSDALTNQPALWHGRIDDRYLTFGTERPAATRHDLADALNAALAGHQPTPPAAPPVGCAIIPRA